MFYTEFRPKKFNEIIGNQPITKAVMGALISGNVAHAYFFTGGRGTGKTSTARLIAKAINCKEPVIDRSKGLYEPCEECLHCKLLAAGNFTDLIEVDGATYRGIDSIRDITETVKLSPTSGQFKIYIVDEVHMLTTEASNSLLKTLEEPPKHVIFILCTTNPEKVLNTIKSRCIQYKFESPSVTSLVSKLEKINKEKKLKIDKETLEKIAVSAKGAFRDAETMLEQFVSSSLSAEDFFKSEKSSIKDFLQHYINDDLTNIVKLVNTINEEGISIENWTKSLLETIRTLLLIKINVAIVSSDLESEGLDAGFIKSIDNSRLMQLATKIAASIPTFKTAIYPTMPLELVLIDLMAGDQFKAVQAENSRVMASVAENPKTYKPVTDTKAVEVQKQKPVEQPKSEAKPSSEKVSPFSKVEAELNKNVVRPKVEQKPVESKKEKITKLVEFPYKNLLIELKESNHSVYLVLSSCLFDYYDGTTVNLLATYSFHKERVMSIKTRQLIEKTASELVGDEVKIDCKLIDAAEKAKRLTDKNVIPVDGADNKKEPGSVRSAKDMEEVFDSVFGDEITEKGVKS